MEQTSENQEEWDCQWSGINAGGVTDRTGILFSGRFSAFFFPTQFVPFVTAKNTKETHRFDRPSVERTKQQIFSPDKHEWLKKNGKKLAYN